MHCDGTERCWLQSMDVCAGICGAAALADGKHRCFVALQVVDQAPMLTPGESHKYCVRATGGAIAITLAWADFPCR
jgi:hypothetical protein